MQKGSSVALQPYSVGELHGYPRKLGFALFPPLLPRAAFRPEPAESPQNPANVGPGA